MHAKLRQSCSTLCEPWTVAHKAALSMGFFRQEYWSGLPFPLPGDLSDPGIKPASPAAPTLQVNSLPLGPGNRGPTECGTTHGATSGMSS